MKKLVGGGAGILAIVAYIVVKVLIGSAIRGNNVDPTGLEFRLMVNRVIEAIKLKDNQVYQQAEKLALDAQSETDENEDADEFDIDYSYCSFMEKYKNVNLFKNAEFAKEVNLDMNVFDNKHLDKLLNIEVKFRFGDRDADGNFEGVVYIIDAKYDLENNLGVKRGSFLLYTNDFKRTGLLVYEVEDVVPVYKRLVETIVMSLENYKTKHNNDLSGLSVNENSSLYVDDPLLEEFANESSAMTSDIWYYPYNQKINLVFDKENGTGDGKDGNYKITIEFKVKDVDEENEQEIEGSYISATNKWTGDFKD